MIVVATGDFEVYHEVVAALRDRGASFTTVEPGDPLPADASVLVTTAGDDVDPPPDLPVVEAAAGNPRQAVEAVLAQLRGGDDGRTVVGVDPGDRPGVAVLAGEEVIGAFQVPADEAAALVRREVADAPTPVVRVGDGARLVGSRLVEALDDVRVELVDETGTTPYLGAGARGMGDVLAAVNIARREGEVVTEREVEPTAGEIRAVKERSRRVSDGDRTISADLARRVAVGDLTMAEALERHRDGDRD